MKFVIMQQSSDAHKKHAGIPPVVSRLDKLFGSGKVGFLPEGNDFVDVTCRAFFVVVDVSKAGVGTAWVDTKGYDGIIFLSKSKASVHISR